MAENGAEDPEWPGGWYDDDRRMDIYALFVMDDVPATIVNEVLRSNNEENGDWYLWLVDDIDNLPDMKRVAPEGTHDTVDETWRSPFAGASLQDAAEYLRNVPKPRKPLCKIYFAALERERYEQHKQLTICKIVDDEVQAVPCNAEFAGTWLTGHDRDVWTERYEAWTEAQEPID